MRSQEQQIGATERQRRAAGAHKAVHSALTKTLHEPAEEVRNLELVRLDALLEALWPGATGTKAAAWEDEKGGGPEPEIDVERVDRILKIMERRAKLLGLDAATKTDLTSKGEALVIVLDR